MAGQKNNLDIRKDLFQVFRKCKPVHYRHLNIDKNDVWRQDSASFQGRTAVRSFSDYRGVYGGPVQTLNFFPDGGFVINNKNGQHGIRYILSCKTLLGSE